MSQESINSINKKAYISLNEGDLANAERLLKESLHLNPKQNDLKVDLGKLLIKNETLHSDKIAQSLGVLEAMAFTGEIQPLEISNPYFVKARFSRLAKNYEEIVLDPKHKYKERELILEEIRSHFSDLDKGDLKKELAILDIGCGTGLMGLFLRDYANRLDGLDLTPEMIEIGREKDIYNNLYQTHFDNFDEESNCKYDILVASSAVQFVGDVNLWLSTAKKLLKPSGLFIFTFDYTDAEKFIVNNGLLFSHNKIWVKEQAEKLGYTISIKDFILREENFRGLIPGGVATLVRDSS
jgi:predicted TPR repeat methyltransferase